MHRMADWVMRLSYLNILWVVFSLLGLGVLGIFPATTAMFTVIRKWLLGESDIRVVKVFWSSYRKEFGRSNGIGSIVSLLGYTLYLDYQILSNAPDMLSNILYFPLAAIIIGYIIFICYLFPVLVHYDIKLFQVFKNAFFIMCLNPLASAMMIVFCLVLYLLMTAIPGVIPFLAASLFSLVSMWNALIAFSKIDQKKVMVKTTK